MNQTVLHAPHGLVDWSRGLMLVRDDPLGDGRPTWEHELTHRLTLSSSELYAEAAEHTLAAAAGDFLDRADLQLLEAVPSVVRDLGVPCSRSWEAPPDKVELLHSVVDAYWGMFGWCWLGRAEEEDPKAELAIRYQVETAYALVVRSILARCRSTPAGLARNSSTDLLMELRERLERMRRDGTVQKSAPPPFPHGSVDEHIDQLFFGRRQIISYFKGQILLMSIVSRGVELCDVVKFRLLPAIVGLELWVEADPHGVRTTFFEHHSPDHPRRVREWLTRYGAADHRDGAIEAFARLITCFEPLLLELDGRLIRTRPRDDRRSREIATLLGLRQFFRRLPTFLVWYCELGRNFSTTFAEQLLGLARLAGATADAWLREAEERGAALQNNRPPRSEVWTLGPYNLVEDQDKDGVFNWLQAEG